MAPFPQVMLRVRFRRQQFFKDVVWYAQYRTFENNRSSASSTSSSAVITDSHKLFARKTFTKILNLS